VWENVFHPPFAVIRMKRILFVSGKGGVGKTILTTSIALALSKSHRVGLLDADLEKPSAHLVLGVGNRQVRIEKDRFIPVQAGPIEFISNALLFPKTHSLLWSKRKEAEAAHQLLELTLFDSEFLLIDTPPGTPPVLQGLLRTPMDGAVIVTTPNPLDMDGAKRSLGLLREYRTPLLGVIVNRCSDLDRPRIGEKKIAWRYNGRPKIDVRLPILGEIPEIHSLRGKPVIEGIDPIAERVIGSLRKPIKWKDLSPMQKLRRAVVRRVAEHL